MSNTSFNLIQSVDAIVRSIISGENFKLGTTEVEKAEGGYVVREFDSGRTLTRTCTEQQMIIYVTLTVYDYTVR